MSERQAIESMRKLMKIITDARADESFDASTCDAGGIIFGDVCSEALEEAKALLEQYRRRTQR